MQVIADGDRFRVQLSLPRNLERHQNESLAKDSRAHVDDEELARHVIANCCSPPEVEILRVRPARSAFAEKSADLIFLDVRCQVDGFDVLRKDFNFRVDCSSSRITWRASSSSSTMSARIFLPAGLILMALQIRGTATIGRENGLRPRSLACWTVSRSGLEAPANVGQAEAAAARRSRLASNVFSIVMKAAVLNCEARGWFPVGRFAIPCMTAFSTGVAARAEESAGIWTRLNGFFDAQPGAEAYFFNRQETLQQYKLLGEENGTFFAEARVMRRNSRAGCTSRGLCGSTLVSALMELRLLKRSADLPGLSGLSIRVASEDAGFDGLRFCVAGASIAMRT